MALGRLRIPAGARVLVAVSGGADSTALLLALVRVAKEPGITLAAAHLHHGLRGDAADRDLEFVRDLCDRLGVPLEAARCDAKALLSRLGESGQAGLRTIRRRFLLAAARRAGAAFVATAHTADDQAETLLLRLSRGTGLRGLGAMAPRRGRWIKPLLGATHAAIVSDLERIGQDWREDASNRDSGYTRNRVRLEVVPALVAAMRPEHPHAAHHALIGHLRHAAEEVRAAARVVELEARRRIGDARGELAMGALAGAPGAVRRAALRRLWERTAGTRVGLMRCHLAGLEHLVTDPDGSLTIQLPGGWSARSERGMLRLVTPEGGGRMSFVRAAGDVVFGVSRGRKVGRRRTEAVRPEPLRADGESRDSGR